MPVGHRRAYEEYVKFVTSAPTLEQIVTFRPSDATRRRVRQLVDLQRAGKLSPDDKEELDEFVRAEEFFRKLKVRAERRLGMAD